MSEKINDYFNGDELASSVYKSKYAMEGEITPDDMHKRMAKEFARIEDKYEFQKEYTQTEVNSLSKYGQTRKELQENNIYNYFKDFKYIIPQGSIMYGLGRGLPISLSNCFVIDSATDSYGGIMLTDQEQVQLMKRRGGVGHDLSNLRPYETFVDNSAGTSTGAVSFAERYSNSTREVAQNGRRGALMLSMDINHPDSLQFIKSKEDLTKITGANISIRNNSEFMKAVENDEDYILRFPVDQDLKEALMITEKMKNGVSVSYVYNEEMGEVKFPYNKLMEMPHGNFVKKVKAKEIFDTIVHHAWKSAEPGILFWDKILDYAPDGVYEQHKAICTNPCGEIPMGAYDSCRLMCLNLFSFVDNPFTDKATINYKKLYEISYEQQRLMDDLVDLEIESIEKIINKIKNDSELIEIKQTELNLWVKILDTAKKGRRTGSGITALADMLAALGVKYDSQEALDITEKVMKTKMEGELDCTIDLAILRGSFENWSWDKEFSVTKGKNNFYQMLQENFPKQVNKMCDYGRRNISWSTIAPTGSVSIMAKLITSCNSSSGCEPIFMPYYMRRKKINPNDKDVRVDFVDDNGDSWQEYPILMGGFKDWINRNHGILWVENKEVEDFTKDELQSMFEKSPWYKSTANDISWKYRLKMQEVLQNYTSHSISSTLNLPENTTEETVSKIYLTASKMNLKGVTVYREGSRSGVLIDSSKKEKEVFKQTTAPKRTKNLLGHSYVTKVKGEDFTVIIGLIDNKPYEIFAYKGKGQHDVKGEIVKNKKKSYSFISDKETNITNNLTDEQEAITRGYSFGLRHGGKVDFAVEQLNKTKGDLTSFNKAMARILSKFTETKEVGNCPECKTGKLIMQEGCKKCDSCEYSAC